MSNPLTLASNVQVGDQVALCWGMECRPAIVTSKTKSGKSITVSRCKWTLDVPINEGAMIKTIKPENVIITDRDEGIKCRVNKEGIFKCIGGDLSETVCTGWANLSLDFGR